MASILLLYGIWGAMSSNSYNPPILGVHENRATPVSDPAGTAGASRPQHRRGGSDPPENGPRLHSRAFRGGRSRDFSLQEGRVAPRATEASLAGHGIVMSHPPGARPASKFSPANRLGTANVRIAWPVALSTTLEVEAWTLVMNSLNTLFRFCFPH